MKKPFLVFMRHNLS